MRREDREILLEDVVDVDVDVLVSLLSGLLLLGRSLCVFV